MRAYDRRVPPLPRNADVADAFDALADVSEILGEQGFRVLAYRRAATRIRETGSSIAELAVAGKAKELSGIGATIEAKIVELAETGEMSALEKRRAEVPDEVTQFLRLPGLGPKTAARIWRELGVTTLDGLREAAEQQRVRTLQGLGAKSEERILEALAKGLGTEPERRGGGPGPLGSGRGLMAGRKARPVTAADLDPLYLRVSAKLLRHGCPHDDPTMVRRAASLGLSPEEHRDMALGLAEDGSGGKEALVETRET